MSDTIHVSVEGKRTKITVRDWPAQDAVWRVSTITDDGRNLQVVGWNQWKHDQRVGTLTLHIPKRGALMIVGRWLADTLLSTERPHVLATMVTCTERIAVCLHEHGVGNGCVDWELEPRDVDYIQQLFVDYNPRKLRLRRGKRYLRRRLTDA